jgi:hypothetical protein
MGGSVESIRSLFHQKSKRSRKIFSTRQVRRATPRIPLKSRPDCPPEVSVKSYSKILIGLLTGGLLASAAHGETLFEQLRSVPKEKTADGLLIKQTDQELARWSAAAEPFHLNCPLAKGLYEGGEGAAGLIWRLNCQSPDGKASWRIRIVFPNGRSASMSPW